MSGQSGGQRLRLSKLNDQLTCRLCGGYFIDATTIIECLHSFCRSCIVKYLENNKYCPICEVQVHKSRPLLNIRPDHTLQDIVYKLVPGCYQNEMRCRREFYAKHPEACSQGMSPESRGEPTESHIYSPDESLSLSLEYFSPGTKESNNTSSSKDLSSKPLLRRYLRCPAAVTVFHLQKLIRAKYGLTDAHRVDVMYKEEPLSSTYTLMDVMYIYHWRRKVPLHLSYRIFESSPKRIKLSEDNVNYKTSLLHAGIDSMDEKGDDPDKKEWKEVQLKISETGVMSITDISHSQSKEPIRIEHIHEQNCPEKEISCVENSKNSTGDNLNADGKVEPAPISENTSQTDDSNKQASVNEKPVAAQPVAATVKVVANPSNHVNDQSNSSKVSANEKPPLSTKSNQSVQNDTVVTENVSVGTRVSQRQLQAASRESSQASVEKALSAKESESEDKQLSKINNNNNNNNNNTIAGDGKLELRKQTTKSTAGDAKVMNAGSKIDALSAKLQFQPKVGQINNTVSKKMPRDKKAPTQAAKRIESRTVDNIVKHSETKPVESTTVKLRPNSGNINNKTSPPGTKGNLTKSSSILTSDDTPASSSNATRYVSTMVPTSTELDTTCKESASNKSLPSNPVPSTRHEKSPIAVDRKPTSREQASTESSKTGQSSTNKSPKSNLIHNETAKGAQTTSLAASVDTRPKEVSPAVSQNIPVSCSVSQAISTFAYTVQDLVNNAMLKGSLKNLTAAQGTLSGCNIQEHPICSVPQFAMQQAQNMNLQQATSSMKNNYVTQNISPSCPTTRQQSKLNLEITGVYTVPPCPDAIPISLMKPTIRKSEVITKGTNLNEICAKIGASGSKINDICAKIGENSKERNKTEARNKPEIPDLLKIARRNSPPSGSSESTKHTNIPNVPVYTPSNSTITTENTSVYSNVKDSLRSTSLSTSSPSVASSQTSMQKATNTKKQNQVVGYKTLRESPRCWNPTLSKNNYIAVKNQTKEVQNQLQSPNLADRSKPIQSKPAKIFKVRNVPRYLGNPASGVKPMYGIGNDTKEKDQASTISKNTSLNMMKIDPKTLSPIVSTSNSPIVSPPPYSPSARNYQNTPFSRDMCRSTGSPISPKNSPVNMLSTNPFIPSPTPNTNPRLIYSHFPPPFPDATRFPNPLIRSPIGIPPPSAFHSSLPPSINKLYQRSSYIPQTTGFSQVSQPPTVQRIPPSSYSSPKSPKTTSLTAISSPSFSIPKTETQLPTTTTIENVAFLLSENVKPHDDANVFNLSKTGNVSAPSTFPKNNSSLDTTTIDIQNQKSLPVLSAPSTSLSKQSTLSTSSIIATSISTATTTTAVVTSSSMSITSASVTVPQTVAPASSSAAGSTSTLTSTSTAVTSAESPTQIGQLSKAKPQMEQSDSRLGSKSDLEKEGGKDKDKDRQSEQTKGTVESKEDHSNASSLSSSAKERKEPLGDANQEKREKTNSQVNGDLPPHSGSSIPTKEVTATAQCNKDNAEKPAREQTNSDTAPQYPSDKLADKQAEQHKQPPLATKDTLKEATQVHNKSETQAKNAET